MSHDGYRDGTLSLDQGAGSSTSAVDYGTGAEGAAQAVATTLGISAPPQPHHDVAAGHVRVVLGSGYALPSDATSLASAPSGGESLGIDVGSSDLPVPDEGLPLSGSGIPCVN